MAELLQDRIRFDTRLVKRNISRGRLDREQLDEHLQKLPDVSEKAQAVFPGGEPGGKR